MRSEKLPERIAMISVADEADARAKRFIGSPTIRLDGIDLEGPEADARGYGFGCRVYTTAGRLTGCPSVEQIRQALQRAATDPLPHQAEQGKETPRFEWLDGARRS
jgi:hypothetical protein